MRRTIHTALGVGLAVGFAACARGTTAPTDQGIANQATPAMVSSAGLTQTMWPSAESPGPPYYARIEPTVPHIPIVDGWAVIAFYRDPACIRADFNLLVLFDVPAAFGCPLQVEGFNLSEGDVSAAPPKISKARGTGAVPFWFVPADAVLGAMEDGVLTIGELADLPGRMVGSATYFEEVLQPFGGAAPVPKLSQEAQGTLADGRAFQYHLMTLEGEARTIVLNFE